MKKLLFVVLAALTIVSCQKPTPDILPQFQDVSFKAMEVTPNNGLKADGWDTLCVDVVPNYAHVVIANTGTYDPQLFELDGVLYTQALKLPVIEGNYCVEQFFLYSDEDDSGDYTEGDVIVFATPETGSHFGAYVTKGIEYCFPVTAFTKAELDIEVLCFKPAVHGYFGFDWFQVTEIVVRQFCFFGDICITDDTFEYYEDEPLYSLGGVKADEEAVFRITVKDNGVGVPYSPFSNQGIYGQGKALCVDYPDNLSEENNFTFELQVWVPSTVPGVFVWQTYATFTSTDAGNLFYGQEDLGDNTTVKSFAIGTCSPMSNPIFEWLDPIAPENPVVLVLEDDLAVDLDEVTANPTKWYYYNDATARADVGIFAPNAVNNFFIGPDTPPVGTGSAQIQVAPGPESTYSEQINLATSQFGGISLSSITTMKYSTYNPTTDKPCAYINFNVDLLDNGSWQSRLVYLPEDNGTVIPNQWQEWDVLNNGTAVWRWSGNLFGGPWPNGSLNPNDGKVTWNAILAAYPNAKMHLAYAFIGMRVDNNSTGNTQHVDAFKFGTGATYTTFNFDN